VNNLYSANYVRSGDICVWMTRGSKSRLKILSLEVTSTSNKWLTVTKWQGVSNSCRNLDGSCNESKVVALHWQWLVVHRACRYVVLQETSCTSRYGGEPVCIALWVKVAIFKLYTPYNWEPMELFYRGRRGGALLYNHFCERVLNSLKTKNAFLWATTENGVGSSGSCHGIDWRWTYLSEGTYVV